MTNQHPIMPPPELLQEWIARYEKHFWDSQIFADLLSCTAARWGADQELEACCDWLIKHGYDIASPEIRAARRPKPPTLKEQALKALDHICVNHSKATDYECTIRRALEALPE
jgi:hypothetical protein